MSYFSKTSFEFLLFLKSLTACQPVEPRETTLSGGSGKCSTFQIMTVVADGPWRSRWNKQGTPLNSVLPCRPPNRPCWFRLFLHLQEPSRFGPDKNCEAQRSRMRQAYKRTERGAKRYFAILRPNRQAANVFGTCRNWRRSKRRVSEHAAETESTRNTPTNFATAGGLAPEGEGEIETEATHLRQLLYLQRNTSLHRLSF